MISVGIIIINNTQENKIFLKRNSYIENPYATMALTNMDNSI